MQNIQSTQEKKSNFFPKDKIADLILLVLIFGFVLWYLYDAYSASSRTENLILIAPIATIVMILCVVEFVRNFKDNNVGEKEEVKKAIMGIIVFGAYIMSLEYLGFDVGTALFLAIYLILNGERKWHIIIIYSLLFAFLVSAFFAYMLPYPMPMSILPTDY